MNNVLPGFIDSFEVDEQTRASIPMRRSGKVEEVAKSVAFLVSPMPPTSRARTCAWTAG